MQSFVSSRNVVRYYADQLRRVLPGRGRVAGFLLAALVHACCHAAVALAAGALGVALARAWLTGDARSTSQADPSLPDVVVLSCLAGVAALAVKTASGVYATYVQGRLAAEVGSVLRLELLDALLSLHRLRRPRHEDQGVPPEVPAKAGRPPEGHTKPEVPPKAGRPPEGHTKPEVPAPPTVAVATLTERIREVELGLEHGLLGGLRAAAQLVPLAIVLVAISPRMAAVATVVLVGFGSTLARVRRGYRSAAGRAGAERASLLEAADEAVRHADLWVSYGAEDKARRRVSALGEALAKGGAALQARAAALSGANEVLGGLALLGAVVLARRGWLGTGADGATLLAFAVAFFLAYRPMRELTDARLALARADGAYAEVHAVVTTGGGRAAAAASPTSWRFASLELRGLRLGRGECAPLSLKVPSGSVVAIVGPTGIGKTTLLRTLLGLEPAAGGGLFYGGDALVDAPAGPRARPFAWVPQDAPLLGDTLAANVRLGAEDADPAAPLESLGAGLLARELGEARLGAGGRAVSGGERQWIALARALATEQPVLLLDEPTSGLDDDAQRRVLDAIARLRGHRTVLMVTHRPEPLAVADVIVRLEAA